MTRASTLLALSAILMAVAGVTAAATSAATIARETITQTVSESGLPDDCRPGITGDLTGTEVIDYQSVETTDGFHVQGTDVGPGRIDWSDGSYTLIASVDRFTVNVAKGDNVVSNVTHVDSGNTYAADGTFLFRVTFHEVERYTFSMGVLRNDIHRGHFHFFEDC